MYRVVVFTSKSIDLTHFKEPLEREFEVTIINNESTLNALINSWHPHVLIYADTIVREPFLQKMAPQLLEQQIALIVMATQYDLRHELLAFQYGADHFLLVQTPLESIKIRLKSLVTKNETKMRKSQAPLLVQSLVTPHIFKNFSHKDFEILFDQNIIKTKNTIFRITPTQMKILSALVQYSGELITREWMMQNVFSNAKISPRSIDAQIAKLKKTVPALQPYIINIYGKGYLFDHQKKSVA